MRPAVQRFVHLISECSLIILLAVVGVTLWPSPARGLQPLQAFFAAARTHNLDEKEASQVARQRAEQVAGAWAKLVPVVSLRAGYTRNQTAIEPVLPTSAGQPARTATILPLNQIDASVSLEVPLVHVAAWRTLGSARASSEAARAGVASARLAARASIARAYFQLVGAEATLTATRNALATSGKMLEIAQARRDSGFATALDISRALAEVERARQSVAAATLAVIVGRRRLSSLSGLTPSPGAAPPPRATGPELPLRQWLGWGLSGSPSVRAASLDEKAARAQSRAAGAAWFPTLSLTAAERYTNAVGFGSSPLWSVGLSLSWRFDYSTLAEQRVQRAVVRRKEIQVDRARQGVRDQIFEVWHTVASNISRSRAARAEARAHAEAAVLAADRYRAGKGTQLDAIVAERDALNASVAAIGADAELAYSRALLRVVTARPLPAWLGGQS